MKTVAVTLGLLAALYVAAAAYMTLRQRAYLYQPDPTSMEPAAAGFPSASGTRIATSDGETLVAWWVAPTRPDTPVFLYLHGNGGTLAGRVGRFSDITVDGAGLLAVEYRGFGGSTGEPTEAGLHRDAEAGYEELARRVDPKRIVAFGESLGTGPALRLASERPVAAVVLDAPYASVLDRAQTQYPWLPVSLLLVDTFRSDLWIRKVGAPVFAVHGEEDEIIPVADGERLMALALGPRRFLRVPGALHGLPFGESVTAEMRRFLNETAGFGWGRD